jgi:hypothetical protein
MKLIANFTHYANSLTNIAALEKQAPLELGIATLLLLICVWIAAIRDTIGGKTLSSPF